MSELFPRANYLVNPAAANMPIQRDGTFGNYVLNYARLPWYEIQDRLALFLIM